jgi:hypothetical protein
MAVAGVAADGEDVALLPPAGPEAFDPDALPNMDRIASFFDAQIGSAQSGAFAGEAMAWTTCAWTLWPTAHVTSRARPRTP